MGLAKCFLIQGGWGSNVDILVVTLRGSTVNLLDTSAGYVGIIWIPLKTTLLHTPKLSRN